jgi:hypothetical protein
MGHRPLHTPSTPEAADVEVSAWVHGCLSKLEPFGGRRARNGQEQAKISPSRVAHKGRLRQEETRERLNAASPCKERVRPDPEGALIFTQPRRPLCHQQLLAVGVRGQLRACHGPSAQRSALRKRRNRTAPPAKRMASNILLM